MKKNILDKKFSHHSWFKEGVTRQHALDYFAKSSDFTLSKKASKKQSMSLLDDMIYDDIITDGHSSYKLCEEEKEYYIERKKYYDEQKKIEKEKWLNSEVNFEKEIKIFLGGYSPYDKETKTRPIIDAIIKENKDNVKTNKDFIWLTNEIDKVDCI